MANHSTRLKKNEERNLNNTEKAILAGAIWIYGGINVSGPSPRIQITMPIPLVYKFEDDFGGNAYRGKDGYFTLQIAKESLVIRRLEEIRPFLIGTVESKQIDLALEIIQTKRSELTPKEKQERIEELKKEGKGSQNELKKWMEEFVESHRNEPVSASIPKAIWTKAYDWVKYMKKSGYDQIPTMQPPR